MDAAVKKIVVDRAALARVLSHVVAALNETGETMPILRAVTIAAGQDGTVVLSAGQKVLNLTLSLSAVVMGAPWTASVSADEVGKVVRAMVAYAFVDVVVEDRWIFIRAEATEAKLAIMEDAPAAPALPEGEMWDVPALPLWEALDAVLPFAASDENRYGLNCVLFERVVEPDAAVHLRLVATDGNMLAWAEIPEIPLPDDVVGHLSGSVACAFCAMVSRLLAKTTAVECAIFAAPDRAVFCVREDAYTVIASSRYEVVNFVDYRNVLPDTSYSPSVKVERDALLSAVRRCANFARDMMHTIVLSVGEDRITITARHEGDTLREEVPAEAVGEWAPKTGFNGRLLASALATAGDVITLVQSGKNLAPHQFATPRGTVVVMPVRLD